MGPSIPTTKNDLIHPLYDTQTTSFTLHTHESTAYFVRCQSGPYPAPPTLQSHPIYFTNKYLTLKKNTNLYSFVLVRHKDHQVMAVLHLTTDNSNIWSSLASAPFGGIQFYETSSIKKVEFLLKCVENFVKMQQGREIIIKTAPRNYSIFDWEKANFIYRRAGFTSESILKNHYIQVTKTSYELLLNKAEQRRLRKCHQALFTTAIAAPNDISKICEFITASRLRMGYELSISPHELENQLRAFPHDMLMFTVYDGEILIAATVTVRATTNILYNFLPADHAEYRSFSPTVLLLASVYAYCQASGINQIDLGTSTDHMGIEKPSLIRFKENIGGKSSQKKIWKKVLDSQTVPITVKHR